MINDKKRKEYGNFSLSNMIINLPFPNGTMNPEVSFDKVVRSQGIIDATTRDKKIIVRGFKEEDILEVREMVLKEMREEEKK